MSEAEKKFTDSLEKGLPNGIKVTIENACDCTVLNTESKYLLPLLTFLRDDASCFFKQLVDICGIDYPEREKRFEVSYQLLSLKHNRRLRVKVALDQAEDIPSATSIFSSAGWLEREVWDMFGIGFSDHPDMRRILTDYEFEGHPLRKDFPLTGYKEVRYDDDKRKVVYEDVKLNQEFRNFDFMSPWQGPDYDKCCGNDGGKA